MISVDKLYERYRQDLYRYLLGQTHDTHLAEDLLSETFCAAMISLPRFRGDADIKTWLFTIARHKWLDHLRKRTPTELELTELYISDFAPDPEQHAILREAAKRIQTLLAQEDERTRRIVSMRINGFSFYEISNALHISEVSARVIDFRARTKLKRILTEEGYHEIL